MKVIFKKLINGAVGDSILNIIASFLLTFATQIIVYPYLAKVNNSVEYGLILTTMGIINALGVSIGNSLNNTRLLMNNMYKEKNTYGDFNQLFILSSFAGSLVFIGLAVNILSLSFEHIILSLILIILISFRAYYSVDFRIVINYKKIVNSNLVGAIGYIIAILLYDYYDSWILIFIFGELSSCIYIFLKSSIVKEGINRTALMKLSVNKYLYILIASILSSTMLYMDRFLIFPILGAELVSIYNVASFLGKSAGILLNPIAGVLLTYYVNEKNITKEKFLKRLLYFFIVTMIMYIGIITLGDYVSFLLYPTLASQASPYSAVANLAAIIFIFGNIVQPSLLRYTHSRWQMISQILYLLVYLVSTYIGMDIGGLMGFCFAIIFANTFRVIYMIFVVLKSID